MLRRLVEMVLAFFEHEATPELWAGPWAGYCVQLAFRRTGEMN